jgi:hypothetical protein
MSGIRPLRLIWLNVGQLVVAGLLILGQAYFMGKNRYFWPKWLFFGLKQNIIES